MTVFQLGGWIEGLSPIGMLALLIAALVKGWLVLPAALKERDKQIEKLEGKLEVYEKIARDALQLGERITKIAGRNG